MRTTVVFTPIWIQEHIGRFRGSLFKSDTIYSVYINLYTDSGTYAGGGGGQPTPPPPTLAPFFARLLVREVGHVQIYPYPVSGEMTQPCLRKKKKVSDPSPQLFFRAGAGNTAGKKTPPWKKKKTLRTPLHPLTYNTIKCMLSLTT